MLDAELRKLSDRRFLGRRGGQRQALAHKGAAALLRRRRAVPVGDGLQSVTHFFDAVARERRVLSRSRDRIRLIDPADLADADSVRPAGGALVELHAHSSNRSRDSGISVQGLIEQAKTRLIDALCLTAHNPLWPAHEIRELSERHEFTILAGMELGTDIGHVLTFGLPRYHPELLEIERLHRIGSRVAQGQSPLCVVYRGSRFTQCGMDLGQQVLGSLLVDRCADLPPVPPGRVCGVA